MRLLSTLLALAQVAISLCSTGTIKKIQDTDIYIATPKILPARPSVVIILTDVFGLREESKILADGFARDGNFIVLTPDLFRGDPLTSFDPSVFPVWSAKHTDDKIDAIVDIALDYAEKTLNARRIGVTGYCFGGRHTFRVLGRQDSRINAGVSTHPSNTLISEIANVTKPIQIVAAELDNLFPNDIRHQAEEVLQGRTHQSIVYGQVTHGFAVVIETSTTAQGYARWKSQADAVAWFKTWLQ